MSDDTSELSSLLWNEVVRELGPDLPGGQNAALSMARPLAIVGSTALVSAPSEFVKEHDRPAPAGPHLPGPLRPLGPAGRVGRRGGFQSRRTGRIRGCRLGERRTGPRVGTERGAYRGLDGASSPAGVPVLASVGAGVSTGVGGSPNTNGTNGPTGSNGFAPADGGPSADDGEDEGQLGTVTEIWSLGHSRRTGPPPSAAQTRLNEKYTFDTFVPGASNRFAHAAAVAVAETPAESYNPLFIWGDSGLGKTHLLHGIGHYAQKLYPGMRVRYVSSEEFTNDFINSLRDDRKEAFRRRYRDVDVLLVDDVQFLEGKEGTQEEFFHTFNTLYNANRQIVISSDRPPKRLETLEDRVRTRFAWGLITDIQPPELETRIAILRKKAQLDRLNVPDEVLEFIASRIERNIRELEGALIRVAAFASLNRQPVDLSLAQVVLRDLIRDPSVQRDRRGHDHGGERRVLRRDHGGPVRAEQDQAGRHRPADRHVPVP